MTNRKDLANSKIDAERNGNGGSATFITMRLSHYCEKARWALDRAAISYREESHVPLLHRLATTRNGGRTVPLLVHGSCHFADSADILDYVDSMSDGDLLYPSKASSRDEVKALEVNFDKKLGPHIRRWVYARLLPETELLRKLWSDGVPRFEASLVPIIVPLARRLVRSGYKVTVEGGERSLGRVQEIFGEVEKRLSDGRSFLTGERFTAADLTFAALSAPVLFPDGCRASLPTLDEAPAPMRDEILRLRDTVAGQFVLRLYLNERNRLVEASMPQPRSVPPRSDEERTTLPATSHVHR